VGQTFVKKRTGREERFHINSVEVEGIVTRVWDRNNDIFARLAVYDQEAEVIKESQDGELPKRKAHYLTLKFKDGKTRDGLPVSLSAKDHVRATGFLRDAPYSESLATFLRKAKKFDRIADMDDEVRVGRVATYVVVNEFVRFGR
jgi:hypothetical protein